MAVAHVAPTPSAGAVRGELADVEEEERSLQQELRRAQLECAEARRAGVAVLGAVEATMAPLMAELASVRSSCGRADLAAGEDGTAGVDAAALEAEIENLTLDLSHYQDQVEHLQTEERRRAHELGRFRSELAEAAEGLKYEKQRVRHFEVKRQLSPEGGGWSPSAGPSGIGRRTLEVRAEQRLRDAAEQRGGRLQRALVRLAHDTATQQATIKQLDRRLAKVRGSMDDMESNIHSASRQASELRRRLGVAAKGGAADLSRGPKLRGELGHKKGVAVSTGKLPHLSF